MLTLLSPAKKLAYTATDQRASLPATQPALRADAARILEVARRLTQTDLMDLMRISGALAQLNHDRFQAFEDQEDRSNAQQAALTFAGEVYAGLDAPSLGQDDLAFAQDHLLILSGLYGVLRPLDLMQPYRLEMGTRLANPAGVSLYDFWRPRLAPHLRQQLDRIGSNIVVNLASEEYAKAVDFKALGARVVTVAFKEEAEDGTLKVFFAYAKPARGMMARHIIQQRLTNPEHLSGFTSGGYRFRADLSDADNLVFSRPKPPPKGR